MICRELNKFERDNAKVLYPDDNFKYILLEDITHYSERYKKFVKCNCGMLSDGATGPGVIDLDPKSFFVHDRLCRDGCWASKEPCTNFQASTVYSDSLWASRKWVQAIFRWPFTFLLGGGKCRKKMF